MVGRDGARLGTHHPPVEADMAARWLKRWGFDFVDAQTHSEHMARFGALEMPRGEFLDALAQTLAPPTRKGPWQLDADLARGTA